MIRTRPFPAPAEVEDAVAGMGHVAEQLPVHEIVDGVREGLLERAAVVGQRLVLEEERENSGHRASVLPDREQLAVLPELLGHGCKQATRKDRRAQLMYAARVDI